MAFIVSMKNEISMSTNNHPDICSVHNPNINVCIFFFLLFFIFSIRSNIMWHLHGDAHIGINYRIMYGSVYMCVWGYIHYICIYIHIFWVT